MLQLQLQLLLQIFLTFNKKSMASENSGTIVAIINLRKFKLTSRVISIWNSLSDYVVSSNSSGYGRIDSPNTPSGLHCNLIVLNLFVE